MNWVRQLIAKLLGTDVRYHRQASEVTARKVEAHLRQKRVERLTAEYELYRRGR